jgi:hypothetical protein
MRAADDVILVPVAEATRETGTSVGGRAGFRPYARLKAGASLGNEHERSGLRPHA